MSNLPEKGFRTDVEGLRGVAILLVIAYHAGVPAFSGGYIGVDVFFVLSGYLITGLLLLEVEDTGTLGFTAFYARRARRLLPALSLVLVLTIVAALFICAPFEQARLSTTAASVAAYLSNIHFARRATNYLGSGAESNPFLHAWSLSVEEQFYLGWPLIVFAAIRSRGGSGEGRVDRRRLMALMAGLALLSLATSVVLTGRRQPFAFFWSATRAWEFAAGGIATLVLPRGRDTLVTTIGWGGLAAVLGSAVAFDSETRFPGMAASLPVLGTAAILYAGAGDRSPVGVTRWLSAPVLQWIGRLSYSLYLWHWPILVFAQRMAGALSATARLGCVALAVLLAMVSLRFLEGPVRRNAFLARHPVHALAMGAALTVLGVAVSVGWGSAARRAAEAPPQNHFTQAHRDRPGPLYEKDCVLDLAGSEVKRCTFGDPASSKTLVLFGDSHAAQWFPAVEAIAEEEDWRLLPVIKSGCPVADVPVIQRRLKRRYVECEEWRAAALQMIREAKPSLVVVTSMDGYVSTPPAIGFAAGLKRTLDVLSDTGARVVYLRDTPAPRFDVPECLALVAWQPFPSSRRSCAFERAGALDGTAFVEQGAIIARYPNATLVDMTAYICPERECQPTRGTQVIYRDGDHLTATFVRSLAGALRDGITRSRNARVSPHTYVP